MKSMIFVALFSAVSVSSALALDVTNPIEIGPVNAKQLVCTTGVGEYGASLNIVIPPFSGNEAVLKGSENGGMAHFVALFGPFDVKVTYDGDTVTYSNEEKGIEFTVLTSTIDERVITTASYKQGNLPARSLTCHIEVL